MQDAAVLTHPHDTYGVDTGKIQRFLENSDFDAVYYISDNEGFLQEPWRTGAMETERECLLPTGFEKGFYERGLEETGSGELESHEVDFLDERYDEVYVLGARRGICVENTYASLEEGFEGEIRRIDEMIFPK
ncbi:hypothetical protein ACK3SF_00715 [Candidatus Nanosalina sp. VS9-1]|uniref:hypothetical protein n=1 Tax=Candidatus Nanosalina sp. VS9-1 TaxID=3388566 RepID=UPI0039E007EB